MKEVSISIWMDRCAAPLNHRLSASPHHRRPSCSHSHSRLTPFISLSTTHFLLLHSHPLTSLSTIFLKSPRFFTLIFLHLVFTALIVHAFNSHSFAFLFSYWPIVHTPRPIRLLTRFLFFHFLAFVLRWILIITIQCSLLDRYTCCFLVVFLVAFFYPSFPFSWFEFPL